MRNMPVAMHITKKQLLNKTNKHSKGAKINIEEAFLLTFQKKNKKMSEVGLLSNRYNRHIWLIIWFWAKIESWSSANNGKSRLVFKDDGFGNFPPCTASSSTEIYILLQVVLLSWDNFFCLSFFLLLCLSLYFWSRYLFLCRFLFFLLDLCLCLCQRLLLFCFRFRCINLCLLFRCQWDIFVFLYLASLGLNLRLWTFFWLDLEVSRCFWAVRSNHGGSSKNWVRW